jgi:hypothetical protein
LDDRREEVERFSRSTLSLGSRRLTDGILETRVEAWMAKIEEVIR